MGGKSGGSSAPSPSQYLPLIEAQANVNRVNSYNPYSSTVFSKTNDVPPPSSPGDNDKRFTQAGGGIGRHGIPIRGNPVAPGGSSLPASIDQWQAVTNFSPEVEPLFNQQIGMAGSPIDSNVNIDSYINQQNQLSQNPFGQGSQAFNQQQSLASGNPFGQGANAFNQQSSIAGSNPFGQSQSAVSQQLAQALDPQSFNDQIQNSYSQRANNILDPQFERQRRQQEQRLVDQGIPMGSEAYNEAMNRMDASQNLARENTALSAVGAGNQAALNSRGLNLNELGTAANLGLQGQGQQFGQLAQTANQGLQGQNQQFGQLAQNTMQGMQGQNQQFGQNASTASQLMGANSQNFNQGMQGRNQQFNELASILGGAQTAPTQPVDVMGPANMAMNANAAQMQNASNNKSSATNAGAMLGAASLMRMSDRRLKKDLKAVGAIKGLTLYAFKYLWANVTQYGVMSDEVKKVFPHAVITLPSGYEMVDYGVIYGL